MYPKNFVIKILICSYKNFLLKNSFSYFLRCSTATFCSAFLAASFVRIFARSPLSTVFLRCAALRSASSASPFFHRTKLALFYYKNIFVFHFVLHPRARARTLFRARHSFSLPNQLRRLRHRSSVCFSPFPSLALRRVVSLSHNKLHFRAVVLLLLLACASSCIKQYNEIFLMKGRKK